MSRLLVLGPVKFDANELYAIFISLSTIVLLIYLQRKYKCLKATELFFIWIFDNLYGIIGDYYLGMKPLDLYDTFDRADAEISDIFFHVTAYPGTVLVFVCLYALIRARGMEKTALIFIGAFVGMIIEYVGVQFFHLYLYKRWNIFYSFLFFIMVFFINFYVYDKVHRYIMNKKERRYSS